MPESNPVVGSRLGFPGFNDMLDEKDKKPMPKWVPVSLLALTTAAIAVPMVLLRRQWASTAARSVKDAPPPRRSATMPGVHAHAARPPQPIQRSSALATTSSPRPQTSPDVSTQNPSVMKPDDDFNGALYSVKAFGIATIIVTAGAISTVWGIKLAMGVQDTKDFAHRMRQLILTRMPILSSRIHRPPNPEDNPPNWDTMLPLSPEPIHHIAVNASSGEEGWSWPSAEERLSTAFREHGFLGWAEAVMHELELEGRMERNKRGYPQSPVRPSFDS